MPCQPFRFREPILPEPEVMLIHALTFQIRTRREPSTPPSSQSVPLSAIKVPHASSSNSQTRSDHEWKPMYIVTHTTTHVVVDDTTRQSVGSDHDITLDSKGPYAPQGDRTVKLDSASSIAEEDGPKAGSLEHGTDLEARRGPGEDYVRI